MPARPKKSRSGRSSPAHTIDPNAAGIDIGATEIYIAVPADRDPIRCAGSPPSPKICWPPPDWLKRVESRLWPWSRPESTGYLCFRFWKRAA